VSSITIDPAVARVSEVARRLLDLVERLHAGQHGIGGGREVGLVGRGDIDGDVRRPAEAR
jgi:hypothetical protein